MTMEHAKDSEDYIFTSRFSLFGWYHLGINFCRISGSILSNSSSVKLKRSGIGGKISICSSSFSSILIGNCLSSSLTSSKKGCQSASRAVILAVGLYVNIFLIKFKARGQVPSGKIKFHAFSLNSGRLNST